MVDYTIDTLANHKRHIEACAAWNFGRWGVKKEEETFTQSLQAYQAGAQDQKLPLTLIALDTKKNLPIGMGSLWEKDIDIWPNVSPWIASLYVHYIHRGKGIGAALLKALEQKAKDLGIKEIYLGSGSAASFYDKNGYQKIEEKDLDTNKSGTITLFMKTLT